MKNLLTALFLLISATSFSQTKIEASDAKNHIGQTVTVCSKVFGTRGLDKVTFINLGAKYPNTPLTVVIFAKDLKAFKEAPESAYADKDICVTGVVTEYKGKPQIVVSKEDQIQLK